MSAVTTFLFNHNLHLHIPYTVVAPIFIGGVFTVTAEAFQVIDVAIVIVATHTMIRLVSVFAFFTFSIGVPKFYKTNIAILIDYWDSAVTIDCIVIHFIS